MADETTKPVLPEDALNAVMEMAASRAAADEGLNSIAPFDPESVKPLKDKALLFVNAGQQWVDLKEITDEKTASYMADYLDGLRQIFKSLDADRKRMKAPYDAESQKVQDAMAPLLQRLKIAGEKGKPLLDRWLAKVEAEVRAAAREAEEKAQREADEAAKKLADAEAQGNLLALADAEERKKAAEKDVKAAQRQAKAPVNAKSATGQGRTYARRSAPATAEITNMKLAFMTYKNHPKLAELLVSLANADARRADGPKSIPGFKITKE